MGTLVRASIARRPPGRARVARATRGARRAGARAASLGAVVRGLFMAAWSPAFMGWPDAKSYIDVSQGELFGNPLRPAGYPLFLRGAERDLDRTSTSSSWSTTCSAWPRRSSCTRPSCAPAGRAGSASCPRRSSRWAATQMFLEHSVAQRAAVHVPDRGRRLRGGALHGRRPYVGVARGRGRGARVLGERARGRAGDDRDRLRVAAVRRRAARCAGAWRPPRWRPRARSSILGAYWIAEYSDASARSG